MPTTKPFTVGVHPHDVVHTMLTIYANWPWWLWLMVIAVILFAFFRPDTPRRRRR